MIRKWMFGAAVSGLLCCGLVRAGVEPKSAEELVRKHVDAIGGRQAIDAIRSVRFVGKTRMAAAEAPIIIEMARPDKIRTEIRLHGMKLISGYDGRAGWAITPGGETPPQEMTEEQLRTMREQAEFDGPLVDYKKKGHKVEFVGKGEIGGAPTYRLKVERKGGSIEYIHLDPEYFVIVARTKRLDVEGSEAEEVKLYGDYRSVGGRLFAHSVQTKTVATGEGLVTYEKIEVNPDFGEDHFAMPTGE